MLNKRASEYREVAEGAGIGGTGARGAVRHEHDDGKHVDGELQDEVRHDGGPAGDGAASQSQRTVGRAVADSGRPAVPVARPAHRGRRAVTILSKALLPLAVLAIGFLAFQYLKATKPEAPKQGRSERVFAVTTVPVAHVAEQPTLRLYGTIVAGRQVDIRALVAGRVVTTSEELREGGTAAAGTTLLAIDPFDYKSSLAEFEAQRAETLARIREQEASIVQAKTSLEHARAQLALAKADLERAESLQQRGNLSDRQADDRRQILLQRQQAADQLANEISVWEARVAQTRATADRLAVSIDRAKRRLAETELQAPFDAYVTEVGAQVGRMLSINDKVATLIDTGWIEVEFTLTDSQFGRMAKNGKLEGQALKVHWTLGSQSFEYPAVVSRVGARVASASGGVDVFARIADPAHPVPLRPGAFVAVDVPDVRFEDVVRVPSSALYDRDTVYVVSDGRLDPRKVTIAGTADSDILIRGPLTDGERVVVTRLSTPGKGLAVTEAAAP